MYTPDSTSIRPNKPDQPFIGDKPRPVVPKGNKDFKKIMGDKGKEDAKKLIQRKSDQNDEGEVAVDLDDEESEPVNAPVSLFDLAKGKGKMPAMPSVPFPSEKAMPKFTIPAQPLPAANLGDTALLAAQASLGDDVQPQDSVALQGTDLIPNPVIPATVPMQSPEQLLRKGIFEDAKAAKLANISTQPQKATEIKPRSQFTQEQTDLSTVNPLAGTGQMLANVAEVRDTIVQKTSPISPIIQDIIDQITTVTTKDQSDTVITLKYPPQFAGVNVVVTSYAGAKGEINIRFENLTQAGKTILDMQQNQNSLRLGLQERGYMVHILTTTTLIETPPIVYQEGRPNQQREENPQQQQQRQQQRGQRQQQQQKQDEDTA